MINSYFFPLFFVSVICGNFFEIWGNLKSYLFHFFSLRQFQLFMSAILYTALYFMSTTVPSIVIGVGNNEEHTLFFFVLQVILLKLFMYDGLLLKKAVSVVALTIREWNFSSSAWGRL